MSLLGLLCRTWISVCHLLRRQARISVHHRSLRWGDESKQWRCVSHAHGGLSGRSRCSGGNCSACDAQIEGLADGALGQRGGCHGPGGCHHHDVLVHRHPLVAGAQLRLDGLPQLLLLDLVLLLGRRLVLLEEDALADLQAPQQSAAGRGGRAARRTLTGHPYKHPYRTRTSASRWPCCFVLVRPTSIGRSRSCHHARMWRASQHTLAAAHAAHGPL